MSTCNLKATGCQELFLSTLMPGDVLVSFKPSNVMSNIIADVTNSEWSHCFIYRGNGEILESALDKDFWGVQVNPIAHYLNGEYVLGVFRMKPELYELHAKGLVKKSEQLLGIRYSFIQLVWQLIIRAFGKNETKKFQVDVSEGMTCSEALAKALKLEGLDLKPNMNPSGAEPEDVVESTLFVRIL